MSGYVTLHADCILCRRPFTANPLRVPSVRVRGVREPVCRSCVELVNAARAARGLSTWPIYPDSYEPCPEEELPDDD